MSTPTDLDRLLSLDEAEQRAMLSDRPEAVGVVLDCARAELAEADMREGGAR